MVLVTASFGCYACFNRDLWGRNDGISRRMEHLGNATYINVFITLPWYFNICKNTKIFCPSARWFAFHQSKSRMLHTPPNGFSYDTRTVKRCNNYVPQSTLGKGSRSATGLHNSAFLWTFYLLNWIIFISDIYTVIHPYSSWRERK